MKKIGINIMLSIMLTVLCGLFSAFPVLAEGGNGNGSDGGGGQQNPLTLVSSDPVDGQKDVKSPVEIKLIFNKNVINMMVKDKNQKCFTLNAPDGNAIPVQVIMADDQIDPEKNQEIMVKPLQDLKPGTAYQVKIASDLQAKNGMSLGKESVVHFTTSASVDSASNSVPTQTKSGMNKVIVGIVVFLGVGVGYISFKRRS